LHDPEDEDTLGLLDPNDRGTAILADIISYLVVNMAYQPRRELMLQKQSSYSARQAK
jgi:hypothetical protein